MEDELKMMYQLKVEGLCCSSIMIEMGLRLRGESNEQFVRAARALCNGMHSGLACGALTGAVCMLALFDEKNTEMTKEMADWFRYELCKKYDSVDCEAITHCDPYEKAVKCPEIMKATYIRAKELLADFGYLEPTE
ncbi:C-GCAxxG-C-C family protein [Cloacibacillus evryensis]|uniref:C-GCAxxG-C-C family protein n=1 Tax=Cloacibacillus evryensis TaxID=508460 RepID=UPI002671B2D3|nr:C-GCAxxG-C-C family protein [Cloacibacillus evryensis]